MELVKSKILVVVGHSMGGAVAVNLAKRNKFTFASVIALDIVEETALDSLKVMDAILDLWPKSFLRVEDCIKWSTEKGRPFSKRSANISIPPLLKSLDNTDQNEEKIHVWRTNLLSFKSYWTSWFEHFDEDFLGLEMPHLLILSSEESLDVPLTIARMKGQYQLELVRGRPVAMVGHFLHEDDPEDTCARIVQFLMKHNLIEKKEAEKVFRMIHSSKTCNNYW